MPGKDKPDCETVLSLVWRKVKLGKVWKHLGNVAWRATSTDVPRHLPPTGSVLSLSPSHGPTLHALEQLAPGGLGGTFPSPVGL